jgi:hypothetical protein
MGEIAQTSISNSFFGTPGHFLTTLPGLGQLVSILLSNAIMIAGVVLIFLIIIAGFYMLSGSGDPQKIEQGRNIITAGVIGFIIVATAFLIVRFVERTFGISILG